MKTAMEKGLVLMMKMTVMVRWRVMMAVMMRVSMILVVIMQGMMMSVIIRCSFKLYLK